MAIFSDSLNNFDTGSPKEHFCQIIFVISLVISDKKIFVSFLYKYKGETSHTPGGHVF